MGRAAVAMEMVTFPINVCVLAAAPQSVGVSWRANEEYMHVTRIEPLNWAVQIDTEGSFGCIYQSRG